MRLSRLKALIGVAALGIPAAIPLTALPLLSLVPGNSFAAASELDEEDGPGLNSQTETGPFVLPSGAKVQRDLAYGSDPLQSVDVYLPPAPANAPTIVMVHGGGWLRGNKAMWRVVKNKVTHWVAKGYIFVSVGYRMVPAADPVTQAEDVAKALAFVQSHLHAWGGDPSRLVLMGHSSGAHLVALLTADPSIAIHAGAAPWLATVALDSAAMNVEDIMRKRHPRLYDMAFSRDPSYWRTASPILRLTGKPAAPLLAVCSSRRMDSCPQAQAFVAKIQQFGGEAKLLPVDLSHPEINDFLGLRSAYTDGVDAFLKSIGLN